MKMERIMIKDVQWKHDKVCNSCAELQYKNCNHYRGGKTKFDHDSGVWGNRFSNRALRTEWMRDSNADNKTFPKGSCNGRKNRFVTT